MKTYKCTINGGVEGLDFFDLHKIVDGNRITIRLQKGEQIPVETIPVEVLEASLNGGCLGRAIKAGWVVVETDGKAEPLIVKKDIPVMIPDPVETAEILKRNALGQTTKIDEGVFVFDSSPKKADIKKETYDDFLSLKHAKRLSFISKCEDKALLAEIQTKSDSKQLKNNCATRLKKLA